MNTRNKCRGLRSLGKITGSGVALGGVFFDCSKRGNARHRSLDGCFDLILSRARTSQIEI